MTRGQKLGFSLDHSNQFMNFAFIRVFSFASFAVATSLLLSSCTVDQDAALFASGNGSGSATKKKTSTVSTDGEQSWAERMKEAREEREKERAVAEAKKEKELAAQKKADEKAAEDAGPSFAERMEAAREEREKAKAEADKQKAKELALKKKQDEADAKTLAAEKAKEDAADKLLAKNEAKEKAAKEAAENEAREKKVAEKAAGEKARDEARLAAKKKAEEDREVRRLARQTGDAGSRDVAAVADRSSGGGFFSRLAIGTPNEYKSEGHDTFVNQRLLGSLNSSNAKIEVDLSDQRARIYTTAGGGQQLVIDTAISSGKSGHSTPTGNFRIKEKLVQKRSTLYGTWMSGSGATVRSSGDSRQRPSGASSFVGAEMPYWMRVNGGIGMHIGYVPNYPASHGCIRVPSAIQPLIYSKVGVGTSVTIKH